MSARIHFSPDAKPKCQQLEAQLDAQERAGQKGAEVLEVEPARGGGSYVLQRVQCGKSTCNCARAAQAWEFCGAICRQRGRNSPVELAEVHMAEAQVVEKIEIFKMKYELGNGGEM